MQWRIQIAEDGSRLTVTAWGKAEVQGFIDYLLEAAATPGWRPGIPALLDLRDLEAGHLTSGDIQRLAELHEPYADIMAHGRIAVLVARPLDFGIVRMWESFVHKMNLAHSVFYTLQEAEDWLQGK
jgi:hypothetical protein